MKKLFLLLICILFLGCPLQLIQSEHSLAEEVALTMAGKYLADKYPDQKVEFISFCDSLLSSNEIVAGPVFDALSKNALEMISGSDQEIIVRAIINRIHVNGQVDMGELKWSVRMFKSGIELGGAK